MKDDQKSYKILLVDDDFAHRTMLKANLETAAFQVFEADDGDQVVNQLNHLDIDLILLDLKMKRMDGITTLDRLKESSITTPVIIITAFSSVDTAVSAIKKGAFDYITKPIDIVELQLVIKKALHLEKLQNENSLLKERLNQRFRFKNIIGESKPMQEMFETLNLVAPSTATVLITGDTGTGKELIANVLHEHSPRKNGPFIKVNCAALNESLLESELFGHEKGSFTGASVQRRGRFELAHHGTLFLDEIGDMTLSTQAKILRVLQEGEFERVGGNKLMKVDVRLVAATHKNLKTMVKEGTFREDLFFRLSVVPIHLPSLKERVNDVPALARHFLAKYASRNKKDIRGFHPLAIQDLMHYDWPGNIRELENVIERAVILSLGEQIEMKELPPQIQSGSHSIENISNFEFTLKDMEKEMIQTTMKKTGNNKSQTAKILGIARQTLINKLKEHQL